MKENYQAYWRYIRTIYPNAVMDYFLPAGEQVFYPTPDAKAPLACVWRKGKFHIKTNPTRV